MVSLVLLKEHGMSHRTDPDRGVATLPEVRFPRADGEPEGLARLPSATLSLSPGLPTLPSQPQSAP